jgi:hypothetical protein
MEVGHFDSRNFQSGTPHSKFPSDGGFNGGFTKTIEPFMSNGIRKGLGVGEMRAFFPLC